MEYSDLRVIIIVPALHSSPIQIVMPDDPDSSYGLRLTTFIARTGRLVLQGLGTEVNC